MKSSALREARLERMWTQEHLAKVAGVSGRTVREYEAGDPLGRETAVECIAKALGVEVKEIARPLTDEELTTRGKSTPPPAPSNASSGSNGAPPDGRATPGVTHLPAPTRLEELVALERPHIPPPLAGTEWGDLPPFTARMYQDIFTAFRLHEGRRAWFPAHVEVQRGIGIVESRILGTEVGIGARFQLLAEVAPGHVLAVTAHTTNGEHTVQLQERLHEGARVILRVFVVPAETYTKHLGLTFFFAPGTPRPWGLVVEKVMAPEPPKVAKEKSAKPSAKTKVAEKKPRVTR